MERTYPAVTVRRRGSAAVLDLHGDIDGFAAGAIAAAYAEAERANAAAIVLDCTRVHYINSTGIALIVDLVAKARTAGRRLLAFGLSDHFVEIFTITRLTDFIRLHANEADAIADAERGDDRRPVDV